MDTTSRDKEVLENKFLIERLTQKLQESKKLPVDKTAEVVLLFRKVLLYHPNKTPKERLDLLVETFRGWEIQQQTKSVKNESAVVVENIPVQTFVPTQTTPPEPVAVQPEKFFVPQTEEDIIVPRIELALQKKEDIPLFLKDDARTYLIEETRSLVGTGVSVSVIDRFIQVSLNTFKRKQDLLKMEMLPVIADIPATPLAEPLPQVLKEPIPEETPPLKPVVPVPQVFSQQPVVQEEVIVQPLPKIAIPVPLPVREVEVINVQQPVVTPPQPTVVSPVVSEQPTQPVQPPQPLPQENMSQVVPPVPPTEIPAVEDPFKIKVASGDGSYNPNGAKKGGKTLTEIMMEQAREADKTHPLISHQEKIEMPPRQIRKKVEDKNISSTDPHGLETVIVSKEAFSIPRPPVIPIKEGATGEEKLSSASNTRVLFDEGVETAGDRVLERHELRHQQEDLFSKYIAEQIDTVMQVISGKGVVGDEAQQKVREQLIRHVQEISRNKNTSITQKLHELDQMFTEQRHQYAATNQISSSAPAEELIGTVMARATQEVRTKDAEADARFRETLRNTLHFKAKYLFGVRMEKNKIQSALDEEYIKHKNFYLKSVR